MEKHEILKQVQDKHEHRLADYLNASTNEMVLDAMQEYSDKQNKQLLDEIEKFKASVSDYKNFLENRIENCLEDKDLNREHWAFCKSYEKLNQLIK